MDELNLLLNALAEAEQRLEAARQNKFMQMAVYEHRGRMMQADQESKFAAAALQSCKDAVCAWMLKNRERVTVAE